MESLINLDRYKPIQKQWGGYVIECAKEGAIYTGISRSLDQRMTQHMSGNKSLASKFVQHYGPPLRVLELYFCDTEAQAREWEYKTSRELDSLYPTRPVYYTGSHGLRGKWALAPYR